MEKCLTASSRSIASGDHDECARVIKRVTPRRPVRSLIVAPSVRPVRCRHVCASPGSPSICRAVARAFRRDGTTRREDPVTRPCRTVGRSSGTKDAWPQLFRVNVRAHAQPTRSRCRDEVRASEPPRAGEHSDRSQRASNAEFHARVRSWLLLSPSGCVSHAITREPTSTAIPRTRLTHTRANRAGEGERNAGRSRASHDDD